MLTWNELRNQTFKRVVIVVLLMVVATSIVPEVVRYYYSPSFSTNVKEDFSYSGIEFKKGDTVEANFISYRPDFLVLSLTENKIDDIVSLKVTKNNHSYLVPSIYTSKFSVKDNLRELSSQENPRESFRLYEGSVIDMFGGIVLFLGNVYIIHNLISLFVLVFFRPVGEEE